MLIMTAPKCDDHAGACAAIQQATGSDCIGLCDLMRRGLLDPRRAARLLMPVAGELNGDRGDLLYGEIPGEPRAYGACNFEVDFELDLAEPPDAIQGDVARTWFYFRDRYGIRLSSQQEKLLDVWSRRDPVNAWECTRAHRIADIQGWDNTYVSAPCDEAEKAGRVTPSGQ